LLIVAVGGVEINQMWSVVAILCMHTPTPPESIAYQELHDLVRVCQCKQMKAGRERFER
jgi:hypothetical protein